MKKNKIFLLASIVLNLLFVGYHAKKYLKNDILEIEDKSNLVKNRATYYLNRDELLASMPIDSNSIVFIGNSLTQYFPLEEMFNDLKIKNRGISGDVINGVIKRLKPVVDSKPKKIFIEIGINDLANGMEKDGVIAGFHKLINQIKSESPKTKIYVQSIFPIENKRAGTDFKQNKKINADIIKINNTLLKKSKDNQYIFIDTHTPFVFNSQLNHKFSVDGVHFNGEGYMLWKSILIPYIRK